MRADVVPAGNRGDARDAQPAHHVPRLSAHIPAPECGDVMRGDVMRGDVMRGDA